MPWVISLFALTIISAIICYRVAHARGASPTYWVVMALILGPLVIPFVFFAKPEHKEQSEDNQ